HALSAPHWAPYGQTLSLHDALPILTRLPGEVLALREGHDFARAEHTVAGLLDDELAAFFGRHVADHRDHLGQRAAVDSLHRVENPASVLASADRGHVLPGDFGAIAGFGAEGRRMIGHACLLFGDQRTAGEDGFYSSTPS